MDIIFAEDMRRNKGAGKRIWYPVIPEA